MPFQIAGWTLTALALLLALWALFADRPRARRRCPRCWYDLASTAGLTCPECGRTAKAERALFRTRRRWRWTAAALLLILLAQPLRLWPEIQENGWKSTLPTSVVMHMLPMGGMDGPWGYEVMRRLGRTVGPLGRPSTMTLTRAERAAMLRRAARGNILARPVGEPWQASYGTFLKNFSNALYSRTSEGEIVTPIRDGGSVRAEEAGPLIRAALDEMARIPPVVRAIRTRDRWPRGTPPTIRVEVEHWWPMGYGDDVNLRWSANDGAQAGENAGRLEYELPVTLAGPVTLDLEIEIRQYDYSSRNLRPVVKTERRTLSYHTTDTLDQAVGILESAAADKILTDNLAAQLSMQFMFLIDARGLAGHGLDDVGFGATAEIIVDGEIVSTFQCRWLGDTLGSSQNGPGFRNNAVREDVIEAAKAGRATLRLRSNPDWALKVLDAERIWFGETEIPLSYQDRPIVRRIRAAPPTK